MIKRPAPFYGLLVPVVPIIFCYLGTVGAADKIRILSFCLSFPTAFYLACHVLDPNRVGPDFVEMGIQLVKNKYYVFIIMDGQRYASILFCFT